MAARRAGPYHQAVDAPPATDVLTITRALSEPTRLSLFLALRDTERCVNDLVAAVGVPQPLVSFHLRTLAEAGLVQARRTNGFRMYSVNREGMAAGRAVVMALLDPDALGDKALPGGNPACCR